MLRPPPPYLGGTPHPGLMAYDNWQLSKGIQLVLIDKARHITEIPPKHAPKARRP